MRHGADIRSDAGFTIVEVIAAMAVLLVGLAGTLKVYDGVASTSATAKLREQGVSLQRELVEAARSLKYSDLGPGTAVPRLQAQPGLADASGAPGWQLRRRGILFTVAVGACTVDDVRDGTGAHDATFCLSGPGTTPHATCAEALGSSGSVQGTGTATGAAVGDCGLDLDLDGQVDGLTGGSSAPGPDTNANDYKRIVVLVRWTNGGGARYVLQDSTVPYPGAADAVQVTALAASPNPATGTVGQVTASATTDRAAQTVAWSIDGELGDPARISGSGTSWSFSWALGTVTPRGPGAVPAAGEVVDGSYVVSARAYDAAGTAGPERAETVVVSRRAPFSVPGQVLRNDGSSVVVGWTPSRERDIASYRVYRESGGAPVLVCTVERARSCRDDAPPTGTSRYYVLAADAVEEGDLPAVKPQATIGPAPPAAPASVSATRSGTSVTVTWAAADGAASYRVYRDGIALGDLLGSATGLAFTDTTAGTSVREYSVSALTTDGVESAPAGPVAK